MSGTGRVAQGTEFDNGKVVMTWLTDTSSTTLYDKIADVEYIHGHQGSTELEFMPDLQDLLAAVRELENDVTSIAGELSDREAELNSLSERYEDVQFRINGLDK